MPWSHLLIYPSLVPRSAAILDVIGDYHSMQKLCAVEINAFGMLLGVTMLVELQIRIDMLLNVVG